MSAGDERNRALADALDGAARSRVLIPLLSVSNPDLTIADAYRIQLLNVARRVDGGGRIRGYKVGLTSAITQQQVGVDEPDFGHLYADLFIDHGGVVPTDRMCQPGAEPEIAFLIAKPMSGPNLTIADVVDGTALVMPALEIVDSRVIRNSGHPFTIVDTVADNGGVGRVVLGGRAVSPQLIDLASMGCVIRRNGRIFDTGSTASVLGHPAAAVAWLGNKISEFGRSFNPGDIVMSGSCTRIMRNLRAGDVVGASFDGLGDVSVRVL